MGCGMNMDAIMALLTGFSQWRAENQARRANQGIMSGLSRTLLGTPYNAKASVEQQLGPMSDATLSQLGWGGGQTSGTLSDLQKIQQQAMVNYGQNWNADWQGFRGLADTLGQNLGQYGTQMRNAAGTYGSELESAYAQPYERAMGYANQMGAQQEQDIRRNYARLSNQQQQDLIRSGMGTTTVGSSMRAGTTQLQQQDLNRLAESLAGMKMNVEGTLGSQLAGARAQGAGTKYGVESGLAGETRGLADWRANTQEQMSRANRWNLSALAEQQARETLDTKSRLIGQVKDLMYAPNVSAADQSYAMNATQGYGYASVPPYQPSFFEQWGPTMIGAGANLGTGALIGYGLSGWGGTGGSGYVPTLPSNFGVGW